MKLIVKVNLSFIYLNVSNANYNTLEDPNGNSTYTNYRSHIKNLEIEKLLPVEKRFLLPNHIFFERDAVYTLIDKIENTARYDARAVLEKRESAWMTHLQAIHSN